MKTLDLDIELLRCFLAVVECKGFTAAGIRLNRTQSAISVRIQKLEDVLGCRLLDRTSRSVELSPHGEQLLSYAHKLLALNDETINTVCAPELSGRLRIGVVEYLAPQRLPYIAAELRRLHPKIRLEIKLALSQQLLKALDAEELDVVIAKNDDTRSDGEMLFSEQLHWVSCDKASQFPEVLPLCLLPAPCSYRAAAVNSLAQHGLPWSEVLSATNIYGIQLAVESGAGLTVLGSSAVTSKMTIAGITGELPLLPQIEIAAFGVNASNKPLLQPFMQHLKREYASSITK